MRYRTLAATLGLSLMTSIALPVHAQATKGVMPTTERPASGELSRSDKDFLGDALTSGMAAVEASKIIVNKSGDEKLKQFADRVVRDQGALNAEVAALLAKKGVTPPNEPGMLQRTQLKALESLDGAEAEKMYAKQFGVMSQRNELLNFENAANKADDPEIRTFAKSKVSSFQDRVNIARSLGRSDLGQ